MLLVVLFSLLFFFSSLLDVLFDSIFWISFLFKKISHIFAGKDTLCDSTPFSPSLKEEPIALLVACFNEPEVDKLIEHTLSSLYYKNYVIFVGVHANDRITQEAARLIVHKQVEVIVNPALGPTKKADNLNCMIKQIRQTYEPHHGISFSCFVIHDAEDLIHPLSFKLYSYFRQRTDLDMVQIPVFPIATPWWCSTHWVYGDEFSENHTKNMWAREQIKGFIPSAGVGCSLSDSIIGKLIDYKKDGPFDLHTLTEDYTLAQDIAHLGGKLHFALVPAFRFKKSRRGMPKKVEREFIATRSYFPKNYMSAVRQRRRWLIGHIFQSPWSKKWSERLTQIQDKKPLLTALINPAVILILLIWVSQGFKGSWPLWLHMLLVADAILLLNRLMQRFISVWRVYSLAPALLSVPRYFYGCLINLHAVLYATVDTLLYKKRKKKIPWKKTKNFFPTQEVINRYAFSPEDIVLNSHLVLNKNNNPSRFRTSGED